jgi:hypothetical protein
MAERLLEQFVLVDKFGKSGLHDTFGMCRYVGGEKEAREGLIAQDLLQLRRFHRILASVSTCLYYSLNTATSYMVASASSPVM